MNNSVNPDTDALIPPGKKLEVYIDYKSPYAYLSKDPIYDLEREFNVEIDWYPLTLNIGSYLGTARQNDAGRLVESNRSPKQWLAVRYAYMDCRRYASSRGLVLRGTQKIWDSSLAAIGLLFAKQQGRELLKAYSDIVYERFWRRELDIEQPDVIRAVLVEAGVDTHGFGSYLNGPGREAHDELQDRILDRGYFGVPTFVIDDEMYFGREHLPQIKWRLSGRHGTMPDIAYNWIQDGA